MIIPNYSLTPIWIYTYFIEIFLAGLQGQTWFTLSVRYGAPFLTNGAPRAGY